MRIRVQLPRVQPEVYPEPVSCPYCGGEHFKPHGQQGYEKPVRDLQHEQVQSYRYKCLRCQRTFRVYPSGVDGSQQSQQLKGMSVLLYVLGLSYGAVSDFLAAMGVEIGKTTVYRNVQAAGVAAGQQQSRHRADDKTTSPVIGSDGTYLKVNGMQVGLQVVVDDGEQDLLGLEFIVSENEPEIVDFIKGIAAQVGAEVLVSDDLDSYKDLADELDLDHQICRKHVKDNVDRIVDELWEAIPEAEPAPPDVLADASTLAEDLMLLLWLVWQRPPGAATYLKRLYHRYQAAPTPRPGQKHSIWYRMRMLVTRLWNKWQRLTLDQRRVDLDGTNNATERVIGWWIKERYRTMRGYKRQASIRNVVTLTARMGARSGNYDMVELYA